MSDLIWNIRFGEYHLQVTRDWKVNFSHNPHQAEARKHPGWRWFQVH